MKDNKDCFLVKGSSINEPMSLYLVTNKQDGVISARHILIKDEQIQALECDSYYECDIPKDAVFLPSEIYYKAKDQMTAYLKDIRKHLKNKLIKGDFEIQIGGHYYDGEFINTITSIENEKVRYNLFRLERENISPCWTGETSIDIVKERMFPISNQTYAEVFQKYECLVANLRNEVYNK